MKKWSDLFKTKEYWIEKIQNNLFAHIKDYMAANDLSQTELATQLNVTTGYVSQVLHGKFDHKLSKLVELSLATGSAPLLVFDSLTQYAYHEAQGASEIDQLRRILKNKEDHLNKSIVSSTMRTPIIPFKAVEKPYPGNYKWVVKGSSPLFEKPDRITKTEKVEESILQQA